MTSAEPDLHHPVTGDPAFRRFRWNATDCGACALRPKCNTRKRTGHELKLHPNARTQREARRQWQLPERRDQYRHRGEGERLVHRLTRRGGRKAAAWGIAAAHQQAHAIATACNLALLASAFAG